MKKRNEAKLPQRVIPAQTGIKILLLTQIQNKPNFGVLNCAVIPVEKLHPAPLAAQKQTVSAKTNPISRIFTPKTRIAKNQSEAEIPILHRETNPKYQSGGTFKRQLVGAFYKTNPKYLLFDI
jgi:hypothetical protein